MSSKNHEATTAMMKSRPEDGEGPASAKSELPARGNGTTGGGLPPRTAGLTESEHVVSERDDVLAVIAELEDQLDRYEEVRSSVERELSASTEKLQAANQRVQELEWQVVTLQTRLETIDQIRQDNAVLEEELADVNRRLQQAGDALSAAKKDAARQQSELKSAHKQLEEFWATRNERDGLRTDLKKAVARAQEAGQALRDLSEERGALHGQLKEAQAALEDARTGRLAIDTALRTAEERARELERGCAAYEEKLESLRGEKKNLQAQVLHLERENARLNEQRRTFEQEITSLRNMNRNSEAALGSIKRAFAEVRVALAEAKARTRRRAADALPRAGATIRTASADASAVVTESAGVLAGEASPAFPRSTPTPAEVGEPD